MAEIPKKKWLLRLRFLKKVVAMAEIPKKGGCYGIIPKKCGCFG